MTVGAITEVLGGAKLLRRRIGSTSQLVSLVREGLPAETLPRMAEELSLDRGTVARVAGISDRTLSRRLATHARLTAEESDRMVRIARVLALADETLGSRTKSALWLKAPNRALDGHPPFELLDTDTGVRSVESVLGRIAYGVYS